MRKVITVRMYRQKDFMALNYLAKQVLDVVEIRAGGASYDASDLVGLMNVAVQSCMNENYTFDVIYPDYAIKFEQFIINFKAKR